MLVGVWVFVFMLVWRGLLAPLTVQTIYSGIKKDSLATGTNEQSSNVSTSETNSGTAAYSNTIPQTDKDVKQKFSLSDPINSANFKNWFGGWQNSPEAASKVVNEDGTPKILYHQTGEDFTVFDTKHKGASTGDNESPFGIFMKPGNNDIGLEGKPTLSVP